MHFFNQRFTRISRFGALAIAFCWLQPAAQLVAQSTYPSSATNSRTFPNVFSGSNTVASHPSYRRANAYNLKDPRVVSQTAFGGLTIGDSHEYGLAVNIFDSPSVNRLILDYAKQYLHVPTLEIAEQWHGVYAKHTAEPYLSFTPANGVRVVTVTSGIGMTMSFGLAEQTLREMGME